MIFIITGSQKFQFNRLLIKIDQLIADKIIREEVFAQIGYSNYQPQRYRYRDFLNKNEFDEMIDQSEIVITHGGTGAIITAIKKGKKVIAVPRSVKYEEHVDNHQNQIVKEFDDMNIIQACYDVSELGEIIKKIKYKTFMPYQSNTKALVSDIEEYINAEFNKMELGAIGLRKVEKNSN